MHIVQNIKRMIEKIGPKKRLSSAEFNADGEWYACSVSRLLSFQSTVIVWTQGMPKCYVSIRYFDLYPNGFQIDNKEELAEWKPGERFISIYLHSSRRQVRILFV